MPGDALLEFVGHPAPVVGRRRIAISMADQRYHRSAGIDECPTAGAAGMRASVPQQPVGIGGL
jgi:hypothetical protein